MLLLLRGGGWDGTSDVDPPLIPDTLQPGWFPLDRTPSKGRFGSAGRLCVKSGSGSSCGSGSVIVISVSSHSHESSGCGAAIGPGGTGLI